MMSIVPPGVELKKVIDINRHRQELLRKLEACDKFVVVYSDDDKFWIDESSGSIMCNEAIAYHARALFHYLRLADESL